MTNHPSPKYFIPQDLSISRLSTAVRGEPARGGDCLHLQRQGSEGAADAGSGRRAVLFDPHSGHSGILELERRQEGIDVVICALQNTRSVMSYLSTLGCTWIEATFSTRVKGQCMSANNVGSGDLHLRSFLCSPLRFAFVFLRFLRCFLCSLSWHMPFSLLALVAAAAHDEPSRNCAQF